MKSWQDIKKKKADMQKDALAKLSDGEKSILAKVLELEWENRHLKTPDIRRPLRTFITQEIK
jgi:hypothetical protein